MSRRRGTMSESLKYELAKDLGFKQKVDREGWGAITTKDAGNMVKRAIQLAEQSLVASAQTAPQGGAAARGPSAPYYGAQTTQRHAQPRHMQ